MVLFSERPEPRWQLQSTEVLAKRYSCSVGTVREAMQRLLALGLVSLTHASGAIMNPLCSVQSTDSLVLEVMAMSNERERRIAMGHFLELAECVAVDGIVHIVRVWPGRIPGLDEELRAVISALEAPQSADVRARRLQLLTWHAGSISERRHLEWAANALERAYGYAKPWLERAAQDARNAHAWRLVREAVQAKRADEAGERAAIALRPYHERVRGLLGADHPENPLLPVPRPRLADPRGKSE